MIEIFVLRNDTGGIATADVEFHRQIIIATGKNTLAEPMDSMERLLSYLTPTWPDWVSSRRLLKPVPISAPSVLLVTSPKMRPTTSIATTSPTMARVLSTSPRKCAMALLSQRAILSLVWRMKM
ncbi:MAG: hypothetical protein GWP61_10870 [Chloroflexi bacterium]|nr:hypothetical protein [Chloroflexota bacterium]